MNKQLINKNEYQILVDYADKNNLQYYALDTDSNIYTGNHDVSRVVALQAWENRSGIFIRTPEELPDDIAIAKFDFVGEEDVLNLNEPQVVQDLNDDHSVIREGTVFLAVLNSNANKGAGLQTLADHLKIDPDEIMAFGDERNDIAMFKYVGNAICMKNGTDHAKKYADYITDTNINDGISKAMNKFVFA
ncbi:HAD-IIB family hydrolase [Companilactobacillus sp. HBUAS59699]|uniref:HAD-IIB family hydrolase n=1 Tax=Companilactobacillus sp. HBUAS59699 TaxID=3109358 RepID=UPI002FEFDF46